MASKTLQELTSRLADAFGFSRLFKFRPVVVLAEAGGWDGSQAWTQGTCQSKDQQTGSRVGRGAGLGGPASQQASSVTIPGCH